MINSSPLYKNINGKPQSYNIPEGNVILIGIPAAFSPTCTDKHLPEFAANIDKLSEITGTWEDIMGKTCKRFAYLIKDNMVVKKFNDPWFTDIYEDITNENN